MPIISKVGTKGARVRLVYGLMYLLLTLGAVSMVYPFLLMLAGATASEADFGRQKPWPEFWFDDTMHFRKYVESKYNVDSTLLESAWQTPSPGWHRLEQPNPEFRTQNAELKTENAEHETLLADFIEWRATEGRRWGMLGHTRGARLQPLNMRLFREETMRRFNGDLAACSRVSGLPMQSWNAVVPPREDVGRTWGRTFRSDEAAWQAFKNQRPAEDLIIPNTDGLFWRLFIVPRYTADIAVYNRAHNTTYTSPADITLPPRVPSREHQGDDVLSSPRLAPPDFQLARREWEEFVRRKLPLEFIRLDAAAATAWRAALQSRYAEIAKLNTAHTANYASFDAIPFPRTAPERGAVRADWELFIQDPTACPAEQLEVYGPRQAFEEFLAAKKPCVTVDSGQWTVDSGQWTVDGRRGTVDGGRGTVDGGRVAVDGRPGENEPTIHAPSDSAIVKDSRPTIASDTLFPSTVYRPPSTVYRPPSTVHRLPFSRLLAAADWADVQARKGELRGEFTARNFKHVAGYIFLHGNGVRNTVIYCLLAVLAALVVNPLAAYALSRFKLPMTYQVLLFCMATMTFPGEVTMIPSFLLLKRFPLWPLLTGIAVALALFLLLRRRATSRPGAPLPGLAAPGEGTTTSLQVPVHGQHQAGGCSAVDSAGKTGVGCAMSQGRVMAPPAYSDWSDGTRMLVALCGGALVGGLLVPLALPSPHVSLLNSFAALVLPGMANGFFIFLLKGFFDSLPQELYESAEIDGAGEWHKFWHITMTLSKPILAVIALNAFTVAYSAFMFALIIVPDPEMWTMMVWIYQLGTQSHQAVVYASLVIAAIPTFLILGLCQNIIMRGLVVPTEK